MKKLMNRPAAIVSEAMQGRAAFHPELIRVDETARIIVRTDEPVRGKVGLISGGGSGHEPLHGSFGGHGMLDTPGPGEIFTSPVPDQVLAATRAVDGAAGVLYIVKNYTGDVLNFEMAAELAGAELASAARKDRRCDGRKRCPLAAVVDMARRVHEHGRSIGMALTSCTVPTAGRLTFELGDKAGPVTRTSAAQVIRVPVLSPAGSCSKAWQTSVQQQVSRHDAQSACSTPQCQAG